MQQPIKGLSNARNAGIARARGRLIAFTDDDCYVAPDLLQATAAAFQDVRLGYASGRVLLHDPTDFPATISLSTEPQVFEAGRYVVPGIFKGANMAFRREVLEAISGFDPWFGSGAAFPAEDCDAAARASLAGWAGRYEPNMVVSHHRLGTMGELALEMVEAMERYNRANGTQLAMRIGIHAGPAVAGVIGVKRFLYDVWGDTVNVASRMESTGAPGAIHVSDSVYRQTRGRFAFEAREPVALKGREPMPTYWLLAKNGG